MKRTLLKSKIHRATITGADLEYEGSITVDPVLLEAADLVAYERVEIYNCNNGARIATYVIEGQRGGGELVLNGAAARHAATGDTVILCSYADYEDDVARTHRPSLVYVDGENQILRQQGGGLAAA